MQKSTLKNLIYLIIKIRINEILIFYHKTIIKYLNFRIKTTDKFINFCTKIIGKKVNKLENNEKNKIIFELYNLLIKYQQENK